MPYLNSRPRTPEVCPICGEDVPARAMACPGCGADHRSGWSDDASLPDETFDYNSFVEEEFGPRRKTLPVRPIWWITAVLILAAFLAWAVFSLL